MMTLPSGDPFVRHHTTWLAYFMLAYLSYVPGTLGPMMPFLRAELGLTYTMGGFLLSVLAFGMILAGLTADRIARKLGLRSVFWGGGTGSAVGALCLALSRGSALAIPAVLIMGFGGSLCIVMIQAILSDLYGERRIIALTESNIAASASASLAPLAVGGFQRVGIGWRSALFLAMVMLALISVRFHDAPVPDARQSSVRPGSTGHRALPRSFWAYWVVVYLVVSIEWGLIVWGADFLANVVGLSKTDASTTMSVFLMAMLAGRILGSRLARMMPGTAILLMALGVSLVGFPIFWLARLAFLNIAGLFVAGLGVANLFPLTMSTAVGTAPQQSNVASARVSLGTGMAILSAPLILGWIADQVSLQNAYGMVALLLMMAIAIVFFAGRATASQGVISRPSDS